MKSTFCLISLSLLVAYISCAVNVTLPYEVTPGQNDTVNGTRISIKLTVFEEISEHKRLGSYEVDIHEGTNLYQAMLKLERKYPEFSFEAIYYEGLGHYITTINGISENRESKQFWGLYIFNFFSDVGVDSYYPKDGDHIIWKYMKHFSFKLTVIDTTEGDKVLGSYTMDYVNLGTSLYKAMIDLERYTDQEFNFVTSVYSRLGHYVEAIQDVWGDFGQNLFWGIYNKDEFLDKGVDCFFPDEGDHIKFKFMMYTPQEPTTTSSLNGNDVDSGTSACTQRSIVLLISLFLVLVFLK